MTEFSQELLQRLISSDEPVTDVDGYTMRLCLHCGSVSVGPRFNPYIFYDNSPNLGCCILCEKNSVSKKFIVHNKIELIPVSHIGKREK